MAELEPEPEPEPEPDVLGDGLMEEAAEAMLWGGCIVWVVFWDEVDDGVRVADMCAWLEEVGESW